MIQADLEPGMVFVANNGNVVTILSVVGLGETVTVKYLMSSPRHSGVVIEAYNDPAWRHIGWVKRRLL